MWNKISSNQWESEISGNRIRVTRFRIQRSYSVEPKFVCIGRKPRITYSKTLVKAIVTIGDQLHILPSLGHPYTVKDAKRQAEVYAANPTFDVEIIPITN